MLWFAMASFSNRAATHSGGSSDRPIPNAMRMNGARPRNCRPLRQLLGHTTHDASRDGHTSRRVAIPDANHRANRDHATRRDASRRHDATARVRQGNCWLLMR